MAAVFENKGKKRALGTGGCLAVRGRAVLSAILLTLHEGQLPANQLPSRMNKLDRVLGNGEGRGETGLQYKVLGLFYSTITATAITCQTVLRSR